MRKERASLERTGGNAASAISGSQQSERAVIGFVGFMSISISFLLLFSLQKNLKKMRQISEGGEENEDIKIKICIYIYRYTYFTLYFIPP